MTLLTAHFQDRPVPCAFASRCKLCPCGGVPIQKRAKQCSVQVMLPLSNKYLRAVRAPHRNVSLLRCVLCHE